MVGACAELCFSWRDFFESLLWSRPTYSDLFVFAAIEVAFGAALVVEKDVLEAPQSGSFSLMDSLVAVDLDAPSRSSSSLPNMYASR